MNNINLTTINNNIVEGTKDLSLALTSSDLAVVLSPSSAVVKITDISSKCSLMGREGGGGKGFWKSCFVRCGFNLTENILVSISWIIG